MGRTRIYADRAEQMKAYRQRCQEPRLAPPPKPAARPPAKQLSRPARLQAIMDLVQELQADYEAWQDNLPDSLADSPTGLKLSETLTQLEEVSELLGTIEPPRGYGRD